MLYAPTGGTVTNPLIDGKPMISASLRHGARRVAAQTIDLAPGQSHDLQFTVTSGPHQRATAHVDVTPGVRASDTATVAPSTCR